MILLVKPVVETFKDLHLMQSDDISFTYFSHYTHTLTPPYCNGSSVGNLVFHFTIAELANYINCQITQLTELK